MRVSRHWILGTTLGGVLVCLSSGCGGSDSLETVPADVKNQAPDMGKMPGFNEMQDQMKTEKKTSKK